jgi:4-hydroxy-3-methylbut-2-en-1-yl diphosphate reductase
MGRRPGRAPGPTVGTDVSGPPRLGVTRVLVAAPRGYCAGVRRAITVVEQGLAESSEPLYVRRQIVHNAHVVGGLEARGATFVDELDEVPRGARTVFSAHGVAPSVHAEARERGLEVVDATCPLVAKVHAEVRHYAARGFTVFLIGHAGHDEVEGTTGEAPDSILLVESVEDAERVEPPQTERLAYVTQTTLSVDETARIIAVLKRRFPDVEAPRKEDICYATTNRQLAVAALLPEIDVLLVIGSRNSSNTRRLLEVASERDVPAHLVEDERGLEEEWLADAVVVGVTSGASTPESLVERVLVWLCERCEPVIEERGDGVESMVFNPPPSWRRLPGQVGAGR